MNRALQETFDKFMRPTEDAIRAFIEAIQPPPEPVAETFMVVDVSKDNRHKEDNTPRKGRYCEGDGWGTIEDAVFEGGLSLREANRLCSWNPGTIVALCREGVQFVVVARDVSYRAFKCVRISSISVADRACLDIETVINKPTSDVMADTIEKYTHDLETAIDECQKIQALNNRKLCLIQVACLDMLRDGGVE